MLKKFGFIIALILALTFMSTNVQCWSNKARQRSQNAEEAVKNSNKHRQRRQSGIQDEIRQNRERKTMEQRLQEDEKLNKINKDLEQEQEVDQNEIDQQLKDLDEKIKAEQDNQEKQEQLRMKAERLEEIKKNTEKIKQQREILEQQKKERVEELQRKQKEQEKQESQNESEDAQDLTAEQIEEKMKHGGNTVRDEDMTKWLEDWEKYMKEFKADEMLSFEVASRGFEVFFEEIESPCQVRGAYFINFDAKDSMDLKILDPKNKEIHKNIGQRQGIFSFNATEIGTYSFYFQNRRSSEKKIVSFVVDISDNETHLQASDIDNVEKIAEEVLSTLKTQNVEQRYLKRKNEQMERQRRSNSKKMFWFSIAETVLIIGCTIFQVMYIKKILDNRSFV